MENVSVGKSIWVTYLAKNTLLHTASEYEFVEQEKFEHNIFPHFFTGRDLFPSM